MQLSRRLCVASMMVWAPGERLNSRFGENGLRWMFDPNEKSGVLRFWQDTSGGLVELTADVFETKLIESAALTHDMTTSPDRNVRAQAGCDALLDLGVPVGSYDVFVLVVEGRIIGGGKCAVKVDDRFIPTVLMDDDGWHNMFCHEVGHAIGFEHTFRPSVDVPGHFHGEYADPYCVMGLSATTGTTHQIPFVPGADISPLANLWTAGGPGVSAASLWRWLPGFPSLPPWVTRIPTSGAIQITLERPENGQGTRLAAMPNRAGNGWWTVEYRPQVSWDRGMLPGNDDPALCPGVVIHSIRDLGVPSEPGFPLSQRVCYEATIPVPSAGDEDWDNGELAVRVLGHGGSVRLLIGDSLPGGRSVRMDTAESFGPERREPYGDVELNLSGSACGRGTYPAEAAVSTYVVEIAAEATGFAHPAFQFAVNGVAAGSPSPVHGPLQHGQVEFAADVEVPDGYRSWRREQQTIAAAYNVRGNQLGLTLPENGGTYPVTVSVTAVESDDAAVQANASSTVKATTLEIALSQEAREALDECKAFLTKYVVVDDSLVPDLLGPIEHLATVLRRLAPGREEIDVEPLARTIIALPDLQLRAPAIARREVASLATKLDLDQAEIHRIVREFERG